MAHAPGSPVRCRLVSRLRQQASERQQAPSVVCEVPGHDVRERQVEDLSGIFAVLLLAD